jgi:hypothetical protein
MIAEKTVPILIAALSPSMTVGAAKRRLQRTNSISLGRHVFAKNGSSGL